jgi:[ribosomal protein S5]-alanine N-acetyltransferase
VRTVEELRSALTPVHTERLLVRAVLAEDANASFAIHGDPETYRFHPSGVARSLEETVAQLTAWIDEWREVGVGFWAVSVRGDPRVIGFGGLTKRTFRGRAVLNAYYRFTPSAWGHGYATEMARAAHGLAQTFLPELPVVVRTRPENRAARAVAEKLGMVRAPELDDHMLTYVSGWDRGGGNPPAPSS